MKQWTTDFSGLANLRQVEVDDPEPGEGEVLVKINAVSLNFRDFEGRVITYPARHVLLT